MISPRLVELPESPPRGTDLRRIGQANRAHGVPKGFTHADRAKADWLRAILMQHFKLVWRTLRRFGVEAAGVDDAAQQVFLTFASRLSDVRPGSERAFLVGICSGVAANARRRRCRSLEAFDDGEADHADVDGLTPEQLVEWKQRRKVLDQALNALSIEQRAVFVLFELEGFSLPEIAESLGIPLGTATSRLRRARDAFVGWIHERGQGGDR